MNCFRPVALIRALQNTQVLIIGGITHLPSSAQFNVSFGLAGGPAGSYAASVLAREGISVTVLERDKFPRYHVGESLIPSVRHYMRFIEADHKLAGHGFVHKVRMATVTWLGLDLTPLSAWVCH